MRRLPGLARKARDRGGHADLRGIGVGTHQPDYFIVGRVRSRLGACATVITDDSIGGDSGRSNTTVTSAPSADAHRSSRSTNAVIARLRLRHHPSGRDPITFMPSTIHRT
jgi:hypothetical protein